MPSTNSFFEGGKGSVQHVVVLGTGAVSTQTKLVGCAPKKCRVTSVRFYGQAAVTGTSITAEVFARTTAGAAGTSLNTAHDIKFASAAAGLAGVSATLAAVTNRTLAEGQAFEVVVTCTSVTAGPGDLLVEVEFEPLF